MFQNFFQPLVAVEDLVGIKAKLFIIIAQLTLLFHLISDFVKVTLP